MLRVISVNSDDGVEERRSRYESSSVDAPYQQMDASAESRCVCVEVTVAVA